MCADAGVEQLHWHQFRHTFAHVWMASDGNEGDLMETGGLEVPGDARPLRRVAKVKERAHAASRRMSLGDRV